MALLATGPVGVRRVCDAFTERAFERPGFFFSFAISVFFQCLLFLVSFLFGLLDSSDDEDDVDDWSISSVI